MIKKILFVCTIGFLIYSCANEKTKEANIVKSEVIIDSTLITDSSWGEVNTKTDFEGLKQIFGEANVDDERICGPECVDSIDVTKIYRESNKEIIIHWEDSSYHKKITMIETNAAGAPYHTASGLMIGSSMQDILNVNDKPINFWGFGWDYGGGISNYNQGKLDSSNIHFRLDLSAETEDNSLLGDIELNTEMPNAKKHLDKMKIFQLYLFLSK